MANENLTFQEKFCTEIREICRPIFDLFKLNFFSHTRILRDGQFLSLMTEPALTKFYLDNKYPISFSNGTGIFLDPGYYFKIVKETSLENKIREEFREYFNVFHLFYIIEKHKDFDELYAFATTPSNDQIINQYINNIDIFKHFILYYKDKSAHLIKKIKGLTHTSDFFTNSTNIDHSELNRFENQMLFKKIFINTKVGEICISKREYECLKYLKKHYSQKEIAKCLSISPRTVETYLNNLKNKLNCEKTSQLIVLFDKSNLV